MWGQFSLYKNMKTCGWCKVRWIGQMCNLNDRAIHQEVPTITAVSPSVWLSGTKFNHYLPLPQTFIKHMMNPFTVNVHMVLHHFLGHPTVSYEIAWFCNCFGISSSWLPPTSCTIFKVLTFLPKSFKPFEDKCTGYSLISKKTLKHFLCLCSWFQSLKQNFMFAHCSMKRGGKTHIQTNKTKQTTYAWSYYRSIDWAKLPFRQSLAVTNELTTTSYNWFMQETIRAEQYQSCNFTVTVGNHFGINP